MKRRLRAILWLLPPLLPLALGIGLGLLWQLAFPPVPVMALRVDAGSVLIFVGFAGTVVWLALALVDREGQKRTIAALVEAQREQDEARRRFMRRLDHEIKNPLTGMRAALANLSASAGSREEELALQDVQHQVERISRLVNDLRKLAELEERPLERLQVDLAELLEEVVETARAHPAYSNRELKLVVSRVPWPLPTLVGDRDLLGLAFYNLVDNALKFTHSQDTIEVRAFEDGRSVMVEVADTGVGISPEDQPRLFEELYRGANARGYEGSGLGLALVQRIISRHGGDVSVRSRPPQSASGANGAGGTVFTVRLPL